MNVECLGGDIFDWTILVVNVHWKPQIYKWKQASQVQSERPLKSKKEKENFRA